MNKCMKCNITTYQPKWKTLCISCYLLTKRSKETEVTHKEIETQTDDSEINENVLLMSLNSMKDQYLDMERTKDNKYLDMVKTKDKEITKYEELLGLIIQDLSEIKKNNTKQVILTKIQKHIDLYNSYQSQLN